MLDPLFLHKPKLQDLGVAQFVVRKLKFANIYTKIVSLFSAEQIPDVTLRNDLKINGVTQTFWAERGNAAR